MNPLLMLVSSILQTVAAVARQSTTGSNLSQYADLINLAGTIVQRGEEGITELEALRDEISKMVAEGRNPTDAEVSTWRTRSDVAHAKLQALRAAPPPADPAP